MIESQASEVVLAGPKGEPLIQKTPGVCGGDACIKDSRIMVWLLVAMKQAGQTDEAILKDYPTLTAEDLAAAWEYYRRHPEEIQAAIAGQEDEE